VTAAQKAPSTPRAPNAKPAFKQPSALSRMKALKDAAKADGLQKDARSILLHAGIYMDTDGWCFPSATLLADDSGYTEKSVRKALNDLRAEGIVLSLPPKAWKLAVGDRPKVPKYLPMLLLWPSATYRARLAALGALSDHPRSITLDKAPEGQWYVTTDKQYGPFQTQDIERFARTENSAGWLVRPVNDPIEKASKLENWLWFGAHLPRAPEWVRDR